MYIHILYAYVYDCKNYYTHVSVYLYVCHGYVLAEFYPTRDLAQAGYY